MYQKRNDLEILALYTGNYNGEFYLREISRLARLPLKTTQNSLAALEKENVLKSAVHGKNKYFKLNFENPQAKLHLLQAEIYKTIIFLDKYKFFKTFLKEIKTNAPILVFGSFAKFSATADSDIDVLVISKKEKKLPLHLLPNKAQIIRTPYSGFIKSLYAGETLSKEIAEYHIILNNHSVYVNVMWNYGRKQA